MNYLRVLAGLLCAILPSVGMCAYGQTVRTLDDIFNSAETNSAQLRPSFSAQNEAYKEISVAKNGRLPDINTALSVGFIGNGFTNRLRQMHLMLPMHCRMQQ